MFDWIIPVTSLVAAVIGGWVAHFLTLSRERSAKRRELLAVDLRGIWNDLDVGNLPENAVDWKRIEGAISGIQLFGSDEAIQVANKLISEYSVRGTLDTSELIVIVRSELRKELGLSQPRQPYIHFRAKSQLRDTK